MSGPDPTSGGSTPTRIDRCTTRSSGPVRARRGVARMSRRTQHPWGAAIEPPCVARGLSSFSSESLGSARPTPGGHISTELRINDRIRVPEVRLVGPNGETVGIVPTDEALKLAQEADLDLVEIAPHGTPAGLQAHGLREVQVRERPEGP